EAPAAQLPPARGETVSGDTISGEAVDDETADRSATGAGEEDSGPDRTGPEEACPGPDGTGPDPDREDDEGPPDAGHGETVLGETVLGETVSEGDLADDAEADETTERFREEDGWVRSSSVRPRGAGRPRPGRSCGTIPACTLPNARRPGWPAMGISIICVTSSLCGISSSGTYPSTTFRRTPVESLFLPLQC